MALKSRLLPLVVVLGLFPVVAAAQFTDTLYPQNSQHWTGHIHYDVWNGEYVKYDDDVRWHYHGMGFPDFHRAWARFDLSPVPDTAQVHEAVLCFEVYSRTGDDIPTFHYVTSLDPLTAEGQALYDDLGQGELGGQDTAYAGLNVVELNAVGLQAIEDRLADDWIAFGFMVERADWDTRACGYSSPQRPFLVVNPNVTGGEEPGGPRFRSTDFSVAPNPLAGGFATLRYALPKAGAATLSVFDVTGRQMTSRSLVATRTGAVSLDLRHLSNGVYLVRLDTDDYTTSRKLVVQH